MGLRGPLPKLKVHAERLEDLTPPDWLGVEAREFWVRHAEKLRVNNLLTTATQDAFGIACDLYQRYRELRGEPTSRLTLDTAAKFQSYAKLFRLIPCDRPGAAVESRHEDKADFDFQ